jgi:hypothetical protein
MSAPIEKNDWLVIGNMLKYIHELLGCEMTAWSLITLSDSFVNDSMHDIVAPHSDRRGQMPRWARRLSHREV